MERGSAQESGGTALRAGEGGVQGTHHMLAPLSGAASSGTAEQGREWLGHFSRGEARPRSLITPLDGDRAWLRTGS